MIWVDVSENIYTEADNEFHDTLKIVQQSTFVFLLFSIFLHHRHHHRDVTKDILECKDCVAMEFNFRFILLLLHIQLSFFLLFSNSRFGSEENCFLFTELFLFFPPQSPTQSSAQCPLAFRIIKLSVRNINVSINLACKSYPNTKKAPGFVHRQVDSQLNKRKSSRGRKEVAFIWFSWCVPKRFIGCGRPFSLFHSAGARRKFNFDIIECYATGSSK